MVAGACFHKVHHANDTEISQVLQIIGIKNNSIAIVAVKLGKASKLAVCRAEFRVCYTQKRIIKRVCWINWLVYRMISVTTNAAWHNNSDIADRVVNIGLVDNNAQAVCLGVVCCIFGFYAEFYFPFGDLGDFLQWISPKGESAFAIIKNRVVAIRNRILQCAL